MLLAALLLPPCSLAVAQGCSQCREQVGQMPAHTQSAYRRGIVALMLAGTVVFGGTLLAVRRVR